MLMTPINKNQQWGQYREDNISYSLSKIVFHKRHKTTNKEAPF